MYRNSHDVLLALTQKQIAVQNERYDVVVGLLQHGARVDAENYWAE